MIKLICADDEAIAYGQLRVILERNEGPLHLRFLLPTGFVISIPPVLSSFLYAVQQVETGGREICFLSFAFDLANCQLPIANCCSSTRDLLLVLPLLFV